jgi:hypothetical protein
MGEVAVLAFPPLDLIALMPMSERCVRPGRIESPSGASRAAQHRIERVESALVNILIMNAACN